jgi:hypothetical protein
MLEETKNDATEDEAEVEKGEAGEEGHTEEHIQKS